MKTICFTLLAMIISSFSSLTNAEEVAGDQLVKFDQNNYVGWTYTRPNFNLNTDAISANKVNLYKSSAGVDYTLVSPLFNCDGYKTVRVTSTIYCQTVSDGSYDLNKGYPTFELVDMNDERLAVVDNVFSKAEQFHEGMVTDVTVPEGVKQAKLRIAAWKADMNSPITVREVVATGITSGVEQALADKASVVVGNGVIRIIAKNEGRCFAVYSADSKLWDKGVTGLSASEIEVPAGFYVVKVGNDSFRVVVR